MRRFLILIAVLALLVVIWIVVQRTYQLPDAVTNGPAPRPRSSKLPCRRVTRTSSRPC